MARGLITRILLGFMVGIFILWLITVPQVVSFFSLRGLVSYVGQSRLFDPAENVQESGLAMVANLPKDLPTEPAKNSSSILFLMLGGGQQHAIRQKTIRSTWLDPEVDWGVDFRVFVFTNFAHHAHFKRNQARSRGMRGEVMHECYEGFGDTASNKCCLRAKQLQFATAYARKWPEMDWVAFIDDDQYPVVSRLSQYLAEKTVPQPAGLGLLGCVSRNCTGFCGGGGIYINRPLVELIGDYLDKGMGFGKGSLETWMQEKCQLCDHWADLTTMELLHEINRQEYEQELWIGPGRKHAVPSNIENLEKEIDFNDIPRAKAKINLSRVGSGFHYTKVSRLPQKFEEALQQPAHLWHYDYRSRTHEVHQAMLRYAKTYKGDPPPASLPPFLSMDEEVKKAKQEAELAEQQRLAKQKAELAEQQRLAKQEAELAEQQRLAKQEAELAEQQRLAKQEAVLKTQAPKEENKIPAAAISSLKDESEAVFSGVDAA